MHHCFLTGSHCPPVRVRKIHVTGPPVTANALHRELARVNRSESKGKSGANIRLRTGCDGPAVQPHYLSAEAQTYT